MSHTIMLQGTGSDVGKSILVAGLCRALVRRGFQVRPFKPQNMSNNAAVTDDGGEIGRAQALQAMACKTRPSIHMNPVLLKPESNKGAQIIVQGQLHGYGTTSYYRDNKADLMRKVMESFDHMKTTADFVIVEGAGSPAEVNLRDHDIANMGFATATHTPVVLVGDIDRGGVIASLVGTHALLPAEERQLIKGYIINKFRGDVSLFDAALVTITDRTQWKNCGILPFIPAVKSLPAEDAVVLDTMTDQATDKMTILVPLLSRIANFDDLDPLMGEPDVAVRFIAPGTALPPGADLIILPGSKAILADLAFVKAQGWDIDMAAHVRQGGKILGLCGGYQMLGKTITEQAETVAGLGFLNVETEMKPYKTLCQTTAYAPHLDCETTGYEIHMGETRGPDTKRPFLQKQASALGGMSENGQIAGVYLHGLFINDVFRARFLAPFRNGQIRQSQFTHQVEKALDILAQEMEKHLDIDGLMQMAGYRP